MAALATPAAAQLQFEELGKRALPAPGERTTATALGDVDGDGDLDLVVANWNEPVRLYLNGGVGTFTAAAATQMPAANNYTTALLFGDVDRDGDLDLVVGTSGQSRLFSNNGAGVFTDATATGLPVASHETYSLALGDLDGDGDLDLVLGVGGAPGQQSRLYLNNGAGAFVDATAARLPVGNYQTFSLALGDVDGDGDLDLVLGNWGYPPQRVRLYLNDGTGTFTDATAARMPIGNHRTTSLALGDADGDGDLDLVLGNDDQQSRLYLNSGAGTFVDATATQLPVGSHTTSSLAFGDVDGDGDRDLIVGNWRQQSRLYRNNGAGTFVDATATGMPVGEDDTSALLLGDVDGDGDLDLVVQNYARRSRVYLNDGTGTFADATAAPMPRFADATAIAVGDVDGDGDRDLVVGGGENVAAQCRLYVNDGRGAFRDATVARLPNAIERTTALGLGDVDGDGDLDLILGTNGQPTRLYLNSGTGTFTDATAARMPVGVNSTSSLALGDVDGDGDLDLVVGSFGSGTGKYGQQSRLYLNNGTGTFTDATTSHLPGVLYDTRSVALGDVDGDGDLDLALGNIGPYNATASSNRLYANDGTGRFTDATAGRMPVVGNDPTDSVAFGDVDGDGDLDLVLGSAGQWYSQWIPNKYGGYWSRTLVPGQSQLYLNNGTGGFSDATATHMPAGLDKTSSLALGDLDDDGDLDMILGSTQFSGALVRLHLNNGVGVFADATSARLPTGTDPTLSLALGDLDDDGDLDLVLGNRLEGRLYRNMLRQLDAPFVLHVGRNYQLDVHSRFGPATQVEVALPYFSTATVHVPLPPFGTLGIDPSQMIALPPILVSQPAGIGTLAFPVPNLPALAGITIHTQALLHQYPVQMRLTNVVSDVILR